MEVSVINRLGEFDGVMSCSITEPSLLSRSFSAPEIVNLFQAYSFWKWGVFVLAFVATFTSFFHKIKLFIIKFQKQGFTDSEHLLRYENYEDFSEDDDDDDVSLSSSIDDDEDLDYDSESSVDESQENCNDYRFYGRNSHKIQLRVRRRSIGDRFSWSEFTSGKGVVKLWDGIGLGLDLNNSSVFGVNCQIPAISSTGVERCRDNAFKPWDPLAGYKIPTILAEWKPVVGVNPGEVKVYGRDDVSEKITVRNRRSVDFALENVTECDGDTWWDTDAVILSKDECVDDGSAENNCGSVGSRCRDAFLAYLF